MIEAKSASSSAKLVSITHATSGWAARISLQVLGTERDQDHGHIGGQGLLPQRLGHPHQAGDARKVVVGAGDHRAAGDVDADQAHQHRAHHPGDGDPPTSAQGTDGDHGRSADHRPEQRERRVDPLQQLGCHPPDQGLEGGVEHVSGRRRVVVGHHHQGVGRGVRVADGPDHVGRQLAPRNQPAPWPPTVGHVIGHGQRGGAGGSCGQQRASSDEGHDPAEEADAGQGQQLTGVPVVEGDLVDVGLRARLTQACRQPISGLALTRRSGPPAKWRKDLDRLA
jgi:hypothetical protein